MIRTVFVLLINSATMLLLPLLMPSYVSLENNSFFTALLAALALGFINTFLKPIFTVLTLPISFMTMGLFTLVVNGLLFWMASGLVPGFTVNGFGAAIACALVYSIVTWAMSTLLLKNE